MINRVKQASVLTPAIFTLTAWAFFMSPLAVPENALKMLSVAALLSFAAAYSIVLFLSLMAKDSKGK